MCYKGIKGLGGLVEDFRSMGLSLGDEIIL